MSDKILFSNWVSLGIYVITNEAPTGMIFVPANYFTLLTVIYPLSLFFTLNLSNIYQMDL